MVELVFVLLKGSVRDVLYWIWLAVLHDQNVCEILSEKLLVLR